MYPRLKLLSTPHRSWLSFDDPAAAMNPLLNRRDAGQDPSFERGNLISPVDEAIVPDGAPSSAISMRTLCSASPAEQPTATRNPGSA